MNWWDRIRRTESEDWFFGRIPDERDRLPEPVEPESKYLSVFLASMHVTNARIGTRRFYGSATSLFTLGSRSGERAEFLAMTTPRALRDADPENLAGVVIVNERLLGPVPYRGGDVRAEIGLFLVPAADLLDPYLSVVEDVTKLLGVGVFTPASALMNTAKKAMDLLFGTSGKPALEIGLATTMAAPVTGHYCVVRAPRDTLREVPLRLAADRRLVGPDGVALRMPYLVFTIEADDRRDDWAQIPDLKARYAEIDDAVRDDDLRRAEQTLALFRRAAVFSPDLLPADGRRVHELVRQQVLDAFPDTPTAAAAARSLPPLAELPLYPGG